jgi:hypothetical protein
VWSVLLIASVSIFVFAVNEEIRLTEKLMYVFGN